MYLHELSSTNSTSSAQLLTRYHCVSDEKISNVLFDIFLSFN